MMRMSFSCVNTAGPQSARSGYIERTYQSHFSLSDSQALHSKRARSSMIGSDRWPESRRLRANSPSLAVLTYRE
jgi:hypothetical protein